MKTFTKRILQFMVSSLPWGARRAILDELCSGFDRYTVMSELAESCGITHFNAAGEIGKIKGSVGDRAIFRQYALTGKWADRTNRTLIDFFSARGGSYIDVGANIGLTTIPVAQNSAVRCVAIEPEPANYQNLVANISANCPHANVITRQIAIAAEPGMMRLELSPDNLGDHRLRTDVQPGKLGEESRQTIEVSTDTLDHVAADLPEPLAIKIDTQGAEPLVVAGGIQTIARAELLVFEFSPYHMLRLGEDPTCVIDCLEANFVSGILAFRENGPVSLPIPIVKVTHALRNALETGRDDPFYWFDVIACKDAALLHGS